MSYFIGRKPCNLLEHLPTLSQSILCNYNIIVVAFTTADQAPQPWIGPMPGEGPGNFGQLWSRRPGIQDQNALAGPSEKELIRVYRYVGTLSRIKPITKPAQAVAWAGFLVLLSCFSAFYLSKSLAISKQPKVAEPLLATIGRTISSSRSGRAT